MVGYPSDHLASCWFPYVTLMVMQYPNHITSPFSRFLALINLSIEPKSMSLWQILIELRLF